METKEERGARMVGAAGEQSERSDEELEMVTGGNLEKIIRDFEEKSREDSQT